jgi:hypothetical protein
MATPLNISLGWREAPAHVSDNDALTAFEANRVAELQHARPFGVARSRPVAVAYNHERSAERKPARPNFGRFLTEAAEKT